jgi:hypothetical protein
MSSKTQMRRDTSKLNNMKNIVYKLTNGRSLDKSNVLFAAKCLEKQMYDAIKNNSNDCFILYNRFYLYVTCFDLFSDDIDTIPYLAKAYDIANMLLKREYCPIYNCAGIIYQLKHMLGLFKQRYEHTF